jgi:hypothetical protein
MMVLTSSRLWSSALLASFCWFGLVHGSWAAEESKSQRAKSSKRPQEVETATVSFRLPRYFASIIDEDQRGAIREIQSSYHARILALQQQLAELEASQLKEIEGLLSTAQRKALVELRAASNKGASGANRTPKSTSTASGSSKRSQDSSDADD